MVQGPRCGTLGVIYVEGAGLAIKVGLLQDFRLGIPIQMYIMPCMHPPAYIHKYIQTHVNTYLQAAGRLHCPSRAGVHERASAPAYPSILRVNHVTCSIRLCTGFFWGLNHQNGVWGDHTELESQGVEGGSGNWDV